MGVCVGDGPPVMLDSDLEDYEYRLGLTRSEAEQLWHLVRVERKREKTALKAVVELRTPAGAGSPDPRVTRRANL